MNSCLWEILRPDPGCGRSHAKEWHLCSLAPRRTSVLGDAAQPPAPLGSDAELSACAARFIRLLIADSDAVLLSKALKAPDKNRNLITEYLARGASQRFLRLAEKYGLALEQFL